MIPAENIVQPPAGFEDLPKMYRRTPLARLFKKQDKRYGSEEKGYLKGYSSIARAKSEERVKKSIKDSRYLLYV